MLVVSRVGVLVLYALVSISPVVLHIQIVNNVEVKKQESLVEIGTIALILVFDRGRVEDH